ncbi:cysteine proteinase [Phialemonium atrogriseum]|uniref:Cysteine proteinase n=1 Tax=Phialemonium atrogriseum TaxID=1093897 RepID=A0AAJ0C2Y6_9PEZI|nr:cysteine proteinase [Phialemonium atrogriseum]KAK1769193.1 cysteine proteinase [Phialemonium atrogriseum]
MDSKALEHEQKAAGASGEEALGHAIAAAELYMQAVQKAPTQADRTRLSRKCRTMIDLAEKLKSLSVNPEPRGPKSTRPLSTAEKTIILRSSKIHGQVFLPWDAPPGPSAFAKTGEEMYMDSFEYTFSPTQQVLFTGWKHPSELVASGEAADPEKSCDNLMTASADSDLVQDMLTDCSVVASLSAAMRHLCPNKDSLLASLMYPFDHKSFKPAISPNGKYVFRMHFNGCPRRVTIDDRLPSSSTSSRALFVVDQRNPRLIWPALMEKAYLKIRGGYDFPGSNSGTDLYVLTGWIPEQHFFQHEEIDLEQIWNMMRRAYDNGDVVVTLGTSYLSPEEEETLGLVSEHDYAVMHLAEEEGVRRMLVKNPWRNSVVWKGVGSSASMNVITSSPSLPSKSKAGPDDGNTGTFWMPFEDVVKNFDSLYLNWNPTLFTHRQDHHFTWEMPSKTVANALAHNPQYSVQSPTSGPVWILLSRHWQDGELDILRNGYRSDTGSSSGTGGAGSFNGSGGGSSTYPGIPTLASVSKTLGFMSLAIYATSPPGTRVSLPDRAALHRSIFVDSPNTLVRLEEPTPGTAYTVVVTQVDLPLPKYSFTLSFFSTAPLAVAPAAEPLAHTTELRGSWARRTAGGNTESPTYHINPQYAITVPASPPGGTRLSLLLTTDADDLPVHVALLHSGGGRRVAGPANRRRDVVASSPEYRRGAASAPSASAAASSRPVPPGTYTAVVSTFEPGSLARFALRVAADGPVGVRPVAPDAAGRLRTAAPPLPPLAASAPADAGDATATTTTTIASIRAQVTVGRLTRIAAVAQSRAPVPGPSPPPPPPGIIPSTGVITDTASAAPCAIRLALELGTGPHRAILAVTGEGEFLDAAAGAGGGGAGGAGGGGGGGGGPGLRTAEVDVDPGMVATRGGLWLVVERIAAGAGAAAGAAAVGPRVEVLSDAPVRLGGWESVDG